MKAKKNEGWAIFDEAGNLVIRDHRMPLYWLKSVAKSEAREGDMFGRIRVERIAIVKSRRRKDPK